MTTQKKSRTPLPRLGTLHEVRRELATLYREAKGGKRDVSSASRLANILAQIGRLIEGGENERRIEILEALEAGRRELELETKGLD